MNKKYLINTIMERIEKSIEKSINRSQKNAESLKEIIDKLEVLDFSKVSKEKAEIMGSYINEIGNTIKEQKEFLAKWKTEQVEELQD